MLIFNNDQLWEIAKNKKLFPERNCVYREFSYYILLFILQIHINIRIVLCLPALVLLTISGFLISITAAQLVQQVRRDEDEPLFSQSRSDTQQVWAPDYAKWGNSQRMKIWNGEMPRK